MGGFFLASYISDTVVVFGFESIVSEQPQRAADKSRAAHATTRRGVAKTAMLSSKSLPGRSTRWAAVTAFFVLLTVAHTWPMAARVGTHMQTGADPKTMMWPLVDLSRNLLQSPSRLFEGTAFYPYDRTVAVVDYQIGNALLGAPLDLLGVGALPLYNLVTLATFVLGGLFTCLLVRRLGGSLDAGLIAGTAFAFATARIYTLPHLHVLGSQWLPLALLTLHRFLDRPTARRWCAFTVGALLVALSSWHLALIGSIALGIVALWTLAAKQEVGSRHVAGLAASAALCMLVLLPIASVYADVSARWPPGGGEGPATAVAERNSTDVREVVLLPDRSRTPYAPWLAQSGPALFPGLVVLGLLVVSATSLRSAPPAGSRFRGLRQAAALAMVPAALIVLAAGLLSDPEPLVGLLRPIAPFVLFGLGFAILSLTSAIRHGRAGTDTTWLTYATVAGFGVLLAFGPRVTAWGVDVGSGLWRLDLLPVPLLLRAPVRFGLLVGLGCAVAAGIGFARLTRSATAGRRWVIAAVVLLVLNVDLSFAMPRLDPAPTASGVDRWLAESEAEGAVVEIPMIGNWWSVYAAQELYGRRTIDGHGYMRPPEVRRMRLLPDLSPVQMGLLWENSHPRFVVVRGDLIEPAERARLAAAIERLGSALRERARDGEDVVYELEDHDSGQRLLRHWPDSVLRDSFGRLRLRGRITGDARPGARDILTIRFNGRALVEFPGRTLGGSLDIPFPHEEIVSGRNTFEIQGSYRLADSVESRPVGETGALLHADVRTAIEQGRARVEVNGFLFGDEAESVLIGLADNGGVEAVESWAADAAGPASSLPERLARMDSADLLAVAIRPEEVGALEPSGLDALSSLGFELTIPPAGGLVGIGAPGAAPGQALQRSGAGDLLLELGRPAARRVRLRGLELR